LVSGCGICRHGYLQCRLWFAGMERYREFGILNIKFYIGWTIRHRGLSWV
jgi:hypothetical protein